MTLKPCKVCGSLNSSEVEICLSCGYPTQGHKRPAIFQWTAIVLFAVFTIPLVLNFLSWLNLQFQPQFQPPSPPSLPNEPDAANRPANLTRTC